VAMLNRFQATMTGFEPTTEGQRALHAEALRAYNQLVEARSMRIDAAANTGLPGVLRVVVMVGAAIGLVIFMILAFDRPFRGDLALEPDAYQQVYDVVMQDPP
jgi:hypothetical protein